MAETIITSVVVPFDPNSANGGRLQLRLHLGAVPGGVFSRVRQYPDVDAIIRTNFGGQMIPSSTGFKRVDMIEKEVVIFENSNTAQTELPISSIIALEGFPNSSFFDIQGNEVFPVITADLESQEIKSSLDIIGAAQVSYTSNYRLFDYVPIVQIIDGVVTTFLDIIIAIFKEQIATLDIERTILDQKRDYEEVITIQSEIVSTRDGSFEKPVDFPDNGSFPVGNVSIDVNDAFLREKRTHVYVYANCESDEIFDRTVQVTFEQPFTGAFNYSPEFELVLNVPAEASTDLADLINKRAEDLKAEFNIA